MPQNYSDKIKDHYHNPRHSGKLSDYSHALERLNPLCGDETKVYLKLGEGIIKNISHETRGCMICVASASVVSEYAKGKPLSQIKKLGINEVTKLLEVKISPAREQCAMLFLSALASA